MSSVHAPLNIRRWFAYMENLARMELSIAHDPNSKRDRFAIVQLKEPQSKMRTSLSGPAMIVEHYSGTGIDNKSNNLMMERTVAFTIVQKIPTPYSEDGALTLLLECEDIALQVIARMRKDRLSAPASKVFADVKIEQTAHEIVLDALNGSWLGYRVELPVQNVEQRLTYDPAQWSDSTEPVIYTDVSGLTCPNLNDPVLGLTQSQRLNCILPGYDFSDPTTFNALSDQQNADLSNALGLNGISLSIDQNGNLVVTRGMFQGAASLNGIVMNLDADGNFQLNLGSFQGLAGLIRT